MLKIKKIYVDSRFKTADSKSHTDFYYDLANTYDMPNNTSFYIDDVNIPNAWYSIEENVNNKMYLRWLDPATKTYTDRIIKLPSKIYNGDDFVAALNVLLGNMPTNGAPARHFTAEYDPTKNHLNLNTIDVEYYKILSDDELKSPNLNWRGTENIEPNDLCSLNEVLKNYGNTTVWNYLVNYVSGFLDFSHYNNIYMSSDIGCYQTLSPIKELTVVRKIPVTVSNGFVINDRQVSQHDTLDCSRKCLSMPYFRFHDAYGKTINLNGCHVSFSIVFSSIKEDI